MGSARKVFVAGGTGTAGRAYAEALAREGYDVTATARSDDGASALTALGVQPARLDLTDANASREAIRGCDAVVVALLGRGEQAAAQEEAMTRNVIDAAAAAGVSRLIYTSVHDADRATGVAHFEVKGRLERYLAEASVSATVLRPCTFMEGLSAPWLLDGIFSRGVLASPIAIDAPISYVAVADVAELAVKALTDPQSASVTIAVGGPQAVTYRQLIPRWATLIGRDVVYENVPLEAVENHFGGDMAAMIRWFNDNGFVVDADPVVERLGIALTTIEEFLTQAVGAQVEARRRSA